MAALTLFPLQYKRQDATPIDIDSVFATTQERMDYLTSPRRYAGMVVVDTQEEKAYFLNADRDEWVPLEGQTTSGPTGPAGPTGPSGPAGSTVIGPTGPTGPAGGGDGGGPVIVKWAQWPILADVPNGGVAVPNTTVLPTRDYLDSGTALVTGLGQITYAGGSPGTYSFTPDAPAGKSILYSISFNLVINSDAANATSHLLTIYIKSTPTSVMSDLLARKEIVVHKDANGYFYHNDAFDYLHEDSTKPFYIFLKAE